MLCLYVKHIELPPGMKRTIQIKMPCLALPCLLGSMSNYPNPAYITHIQHMPTAQHILFSFSMLQAKVINSQSLSLCTITASAEKLVLLFLDLLETFLNAS